jgi:hypothetical protein
MMEGLKSTEWINLGLVGKVQIPHERVSTHVVRVFTPPATT